MCGGSESLDSTAAPSKSSIRHPPRPFGRRATSCLSQSASASRSSISPDPRLWSKNLLVRTCPLHDRLAIARDGPSPEVASGELNRGAIGGGIQGSSRASPCRQSVDSQAPGRAFKLIERYQESRRIKIRLTGSFIRAGTGSFNREAWLTTQKRSLATSLLSGIPAFPVRQLAP